MSRLRETDIFKKYVQKRFVKSQFLTSGLAPKSADPEKVAPRLRETHFFPEIGIWSGGGLEEMSFRLRETTLFS